MAEQLNLKKFRLAESINFLVENKYLIEMADKDDYYYYSLDPITFDGLICLRSESESTYRINKNLKPIALLRAYAPQRGHKKCSPEGHKKGLEWALNVSHWVTNCAPKEESTVRNYSAFEMLKYTLLKYIYLNGFSEARGQTILQIVSEIKNPEFLIKQLVALIQSGPSYGRAISDVLVNAHSSRCDVWNKPIRTNALMYVVTCWPELKKDFQNVPHPNLNQSEEVADQRKELAELIGEFPIEQNQPGTVVEFKKAGT